MPARAGRPETEWSRRAPLHRPPPPAPPADRPCSAYAPAPAARAAPPAGRDRAPPLRAREVAAHAPLSGPQGPLLRRKGTPLSDVRLPPAVEDYVDNFVRPSSPGRLWGDLHPSGTRFQ